MILPIIKEQAHGQYINLTIRLGIQVSKEKKINSRIKSDPGIGSIEKNITAWLTTKYNFEELNENGLRKKEPDKCPVLVSTLLHLL